MMRPPSVMRLAACWEPHHLVFMFSASCSSNFSMEMSGRAYILRSRLPPALLTMMSRRPELIDHPVEHLGDGGEVHHVGGDAEPPLAARLDLLGDRIHVVLAPGQHHDIGPAVGECQGDAAADAGRPPPVTTATLPSSRNSSCMPMAFPQEKAQA